MKMFELDESTNSKIEIKLYKNVENVKPLRVKLMKGELKCCMVKPSLVIDPFQIVVSANKAVTAEKRTTKSVFTEILFNLSISKNITNSLKTFGVEDEDRSVLVVCVVAEDEDNRDAYNHIHGDEEMLSNLKDYSNIDAIRKQYKIDDKEYSSVPLLDSVVSRIATKEFLYH